MWSAKIRCKHVWQHLDDKGFIKGEKYNVIDDKLILPNGTKSNGTYNCIERINECFYAIFEEVRKQ